ncbi:cytochrome P450 2F2-like [Rhinophrynus dorsalis]
MPCGLIPEDRESMPKFGTPLGHDINRGLLFENQRPIKMILRVASNKAKLLSVLEYTGNMTDLNTLAFFLVAFTAYWLAGFIVEHTWRRRKMPPGPFSLPILGNFLQIYSEGLVPWLVKMGEKYGPVFTIYFGSRRIVILNGYQAVKEALIDKGDIFIGRGKFPLYERVLNHDGQPTDPNFILICASTNVITNIVLSTHFDYSDEKWLKILHDVQEGLAEQSSIWGHLYNLFPDIMKFLPGPHRRIFKLLNAPDDVINERIEHNMKTLDPSCPRNFTDCYLIRMEQKTHLALMRLTAAIFLRQSMRSWTLLTQKLHFERLLKRRLWNHENLHNEIDQVIGHTRDPTIEDVSKMNYMNAVIHEIQRYGDISPTAAPHYVIKDTMLHGYHIYKGTEVIPLLTTVLRDKSQFETPEEVNANHFLDENGKFKKNDAFIPFSAGRRLCIAESLVRMELFIFFTTILQKFTLKPTVDPKAMNIDPIKHNIGNVPAGHKVMFIPRE